MNWFRVTFVFAGLVSMFGLSTGCTIKSTEAADSGAGVVSSPDSGGGVVSNPDSGADVVSNPDSGGDVVSNPDSGADVVSSLESGGDVMSNPDSGADVVSNPDSGADVVSSLESGADVMSNPDSGASPYADRFSADFVLTCSEHPWSGVYTQGSSFQGKVRYLVECTHSAANELTVRFSEVQTGTIGLNDFGMSFTGVTGSGTYKTDGTDTNVIGLSAGTPDEGTGANTQQNAGGIGPDENPYPARDYPCTVVVQTNLADVTPTHEGTPFGIALDVTCPKVGTVGNFPIDCDVSPSTFRFAASACMAYAP